MCQLENPVVDRVSLQTFIVNNNDDNKPLTGGGYLEERRITRIGL